MSNLFRIGGVYRDGNTSLYMLVEAGGSEDYADSIHIGEGIHSGRHRLSDGRFDCCKNEESQFHLLPGEFREVDGEWVPVEEKPAQSLGALIRAQQSRLTQAKAEPAHPDEMSLDELLADLLSPAAAAEPLRAPLD